MRINFDGSKALPEDGRALIRHLEERVTTGTSFRSGDMIQIGWTLANVRDDSDGGLRLYEPDMKEIPIRWTEGVTTTLAHLRLQKDAAASFGREPDFPSIRDSILIANDLVQTSTSFVLERGHPSANDSGWFLGVRGTSLDYNESSNLRRDSLYRTALDHPQLIMYLALPAGFRVLINGRSARFFLEGKPADPAPGTLLAELAAQTR